MPWSPAPSSWLPGCSAVDALRNIGGLRMQQDLDIAGFPVEAFLLVTNVLDGAAHHAFYLLVGDGRRTASFARDHHLVGGGERFARGTDRPGIDARLWTFAVKQVDDLIRDTVADLVRMTLGNRLAGEQIGRAHQVPPLFPSRPRRSFVMCLKTNTVSKPDHAGTPSFSCRSQLSACCTICSRWS